MANHMQVAHRWAQMNRNLDVRGYAMFAEGFSIYSHGRHFEIARWTPTTPAKGAEGVPAMCILFESAGYSVSTAKHKTYTLRAIRGSADVFTLPKAFWPVYGGGNGSDAQRRKDNKNAATEGLKYYEAQALESLEKASRARTWADSYIERAERILSEAERFARTFGVKYERPNVDGLKAKAAKQAAETAKAAAKARKEQAKRDAIREAEQAEVRAQWLAGEDVRAGYFSAPDGSAYVRRHGDDLETSQGASVPWAHAVKAFRFVKLVRERGTPWHTNGQTVRVGHYRVDEIDAQGNMRAGCHRFTWDAMNALAIAQGVFDAPSSDAVEQSH